MHIKFQCFELAGMLFAFGLTGAGLILPWEIAEGAMPSLEEYGYYESSTNQKHVYGLWRYEQCMDISDDPDVMAGAGYQEFISRSNGNNCIFGKTVDLPKQNTSNVSLRVSQIFSVMAIFLTLPGVAYAFLSQRFRFAMVSLVASFCCAIALGTVSCSTVEQDEKEACFFGPFMRHGNDA